jgi:hypothetical protein
MDIFTNCINVFYPSLHKDSPNTIVEFGISKEPEYVASSAIRDSEISDQDDLMDLPRPR